MKMCFGKFNKDDVQRNARKHYHKSVSNLFDLYGDCFILNNFFRLAVLHHGMLDVFDLEESPNEYVWSIYFRQKSG